MANPLINELLIGTGSKDRFSMDQPRNDSQFANFFLDPAIVALDEYGIPLELARKIQTHIIADGDLDATLDRLRTLKASQVAGLSSFEIRLIEEAQADL